MIRKLAIKVLLRKILISPFSIYQPFKRGIWFTKAAFEQLGRSPTT